MVIGQELVERCDQHDRCARVTVPERSSELSELSGIWHFRLVGAAWWISGPSGQQLRLDLGPFQDPAAVLPGAIPGIVLSDAAVLITAAARNLAS
jgi:hypothetical protein